jgi:hypothetical protein
MTPATVILSSKDVAYNDKMKMMMQKIRREALQMMEICSMRVSRTPKQQKTHILASFACISTQVVINQLFQCRLMTARLLLVWRMYFLSVARYTSYVLSYRSSIRMIFHGLCCFVVLLSL